MVPTIEKTQRYRGIQVLRALSVLLVIWTHTKYAADFSDNPYISTSFGAIGVDIFFVISGFVISLSAKSLQYDARQFFINRIARVAPIYWLTAIPIIAVAAAKEKSSWQGVISTFTFLPLFDFNVYHTPANEFAWTLAYEFWFYTSAAIFMSKFRQNFGHVLALVMTLCALLVHTFYTGSYLLPYIIFNPFFLEFFYGVFIFQLMNKFGVKSLIFFGVGASVTFYIARLDIEIGDYMLTATGGLQRAVIMGGFGAFLVATFVAAERNGLTVWPAWLVFIGECSYAIYLVQPYGLTIASKIVKTFGMNRWVGALIFICVSIGLGMLVTTFLEKKLTKLARTAMSRLLWKKDMREANSLGRI